MGSDGKPESIAAQSIGRSDGCRVRSGLRSTCCPMNCRQVSLAVIAVAAALGLAGCGERKLNTEKLQVDLERDIERQTRVKGISVYCPGDVRATADSVFTCDAVDPTGHKARVRVTQQAQRLVYSVHG